MSTTSGATLRNLREGIGLTSSEASTILSIPQTKYVGYERRATGVPVSMLSDLVSTYRMANSRSIDMYSKMINAQISLMVPSQEVGKDLNFIQSCKFSTQIMLFRACVISDQGQLWITDDEGSPMMYLDHGGFTHLDNEGNIIEEDMENLGIFFNEVTPEDIIKGAK